MALATLDRQLLRIFAPFQAPMAPSVAAETPPQLIGRRRPVRFPRSLSATTKHVRSNLPTVQSTVGVVRTHRLVRRRRAASPRSAWATAMRAQSKPPTAPSSAGAATPTVNPRCRRHEARSCFCVVAMIAFVACNSSSTTSLRLNVSYDSTWQLSNPDVILGFSALQV